MFHRNAFASVCASSRLQMDNTRNVPNEGYDLDSLAILRIVRQFIHVVTVAILTFALRLNLEMSRKKNSKDILFSLAMVRSLSAKCEKEKLLLKTFYPKIHSSTQLVIYYLILSI